MRLEFQSYSICQVQANFQLNCCHFNNCRKLKIIMQNFMSGNDRASKATAGQILQNNSTRKLTSHIHLMNFNCVTRESFILKGYHIAPSPAPTLKTFHIHNFPTIFLSSCTEEWKEMQEEIRLKILNYAWESLKCPWALLKLNDINSADVLRHYEFKIWKILKHQLDLFYNRKHQISLIAHPIQEAHNPPTVSEALNLGSIIFPGGVENET